MHLVQDHVLQLLVEDRARENVSVEGLSTNATVHDILSGVIETIPYQSFGCCRSRVSRSQLFPKSRPIGLSALVHPSLPHEEFEKFSHGHTRWKSMGVHNEIRRVSHLVEGHVNLINNQSAHTLLAVPRRKLVPYLRPPDLMDHNFYQEVFAFIGSDKDFVNVDRDCAFVGKRRRLVVHRHCARPVAHSKIANRTRQISWRLFVDHDNSVV
mmetsp:Transcript_43263/g.85032  ORF Transcript_43263/g.85032 Transcript_43263/m.85032 type:complete len:211 (-) Transcript_43263:2599-3231(-)